jgi:hypothetical protein
MEEAAWVVVVGRRVVAEGVTTLVSYFVSYILTSVEFSL